MILEDEKHSFEWFEDLSKVRAFRALQQDVPALDVPTLNWLANFFAAREFYLEALPAELCVRRRIYSSDELAMVGGAALEIRLLIQRMAERVA